MMFRNTNNIKKISQIYILKTKMSIQHLMKKIIILLLFGTLPFFAFSQLKLGFGGGVGVNFASLNSSFDYGNKSKTGFHIGAIGTMAIGKNDNLFLVGGFDFDQKGGTNVVSGTNSTFYLGIPVLIRYTFSPKQDFPLKIFINTGPYIGMLLGRSVSNPLATSSSENSNSASFFETGLAFGGGVLYPLGNGNLFLEGRQSFALSSLVKNSLQRNQMFTISAGYIYLLGAKSQEKADKTIDSGFE
jgi:hypothetical protein